MPPNLEDARCHLATIRTTLETIEAFPGDAALRPELDDIAGSAREALVALLEQHQQSLLCDQGSYDVVALQALKDEVIRLAVEGLPCRTLDRLMMVGVFEAGGRVEAGAADSIAEPRYRYALPQDDTWPALQALSPHAFAVRLLADVSTALLDQQSYLDLARFDQLVFQKLVAMTYCNQVAGDP